MFISRLLLIFFWGVQQVSTIKEKKIGRKKFEKSKKTKGDWNFQHNFKKTQQ
jgi:hypothetical protein